MDSHEINGGPAFPFTPSDPREPGLPGMSLRDWFAGHAMQTIITWDSWSRKAGESFDQAMARIAYEYADAMLAEREKGHD